MIKQVYYIGTGAKSAMWTLRMTRQSDDAFANQFVPDVYLCNLASADLDDNGLDRAIEKAKAYADAMRERIGETDDFKVVFGGVWDDAVNVRRGKLSVRDTHNIEVIEAGSFPFGKHAGTKIAAAPDGYVLFFADKLPHATDAVSYALAAACAGVALEKGLIAKREAARTERRELDEKSSWVGQIGERMTFTGEIVSYVFKAGSVHYVDNYEYTTVRTPEGDLVSWYNNKLGERGETVTFKATVKKHLDKDGILSTRVNRPKKVS